MQSPTQSTHRFPVTFDPADPAFLADRYARYRELRDLTPVADAVVNGQDTVVLTRYDDVRTVFTDPAVRVQPRAGEFPAHIGGGAAAEFYRLSLPEMDPPSHTRLRTLALSAFSRRTVTAMRPWVADIIEAGLHRLREFDGEVDFVAEFATRVPAEIACRLLHAPAADAHTVLERMPALNAVLGHGEISAQRLAAADRAAEFYFDYVGGIIEDLRGRLPEDDAVGALLAAEDADGGLNRTELIVLLVGFFVASYHTTMVAMTNALYALLQHPDQLAGLADHPESAPRAWEESLRFHSPIHFLQRYAGADMEFHGRPVAEGTHILLGVAAANRDERMFPDADRFDVTRGRSRHLAFAAGGHFCLGAPLSRIEGDLFLRMLPRTLPGLALAGPSPVWGTDPTFPTLSALTVTARL